MGRLLALLLLLPALSAGTSAPSPGDVEKFLFFAALEGLYVEGVSTADVREILREETDAGGKKSYVHFVYGCPVCMPVVNACRVYEGRPDFYADKLKASTFGRGLAPELSAQLRSPEFKERLDAVHTLVDRFVRMRFASMRLGEDERALWQQALEEARKQGMAALTAAQREQGMKSCPSCDAATGR